MKRVPTSEQAKTYGRWVAYSLAIPVALAVMYAAMTSSGMTEHLPPPFSFRMSWPTAGCIFVVAVIVHAIGAIRLRRQWQAEE